MLHVVGEILVDRFIDGNKESAFPGGAPFNVAYNVNFWKHDVSFTGAIGKDEFGKMLASFVRKQHFKINNLSKLSSRYTTEAIVTLVDGERSFKFKRDEGADYAISFNKIAKLPLSSGDIFHIGSLMLSFSRGRKLFYKAINYAKSKGCLISFDINYRDDIFESSSTAKRIFKKAIKEADIIKVSSEEIAVLTNKKTLNSQLKSLFNENQKVFLSLGKEGSIAYINGEIIRAKTNEVRPVDTTGAGDAFYSYVLYSLDNGEKDYLKILEKANYVGAMATLKKGAVGVVPKIESILEYNS